jgi:hypothetical protein
MPPEPQVGSQMRMPSLGASSSTMSAHHLVGGVELAALLAGVVGELLDEVLVRAPEHVRLGELGVGQRQLGEVLHQAVQDGVAVLGVAELTFVVEVDAGQHALERCVLLFERGIQALLSASPMLVAVFWSCGQRAARDEELVLVGVLGTSARAFSDEPLGLLDRSGRRGV